MFILYTESVLNSKHVKRKKHECLKTPYLCGLEGEPGALHCGFLRAVAGYLVPV